MRKGNPLKAVAIHTTSGSRPCLEDHADSNREKGILVVADGFGGPVAGIEAARAACSSVRNFLEKEAGDDEATLPFVLRSYYSLAGNVLFNSLVHANRSLTALNKGRNVHEKGGASAVAGYLDGHLLALAGVGACSAWMFRGGQVSRLLVPRNYAWLRSPVDDDPDPQFSAPLAALGMHADLEPEIIECQVRPGDWVILQTEGLRREHREALLEVHRRGLAPQGAAAEGQKVLEGAHFELNSSTLLAIF